jgi:signal transduction histidine kinase
MMDPIPAALRASLHDDPGAGFHAAVTELATGALHFACWCGPEAEALHVAPASLMLPEELRELAAHTRHPDSFPLRALSPALDAEFPGADLLLLPLPADADAPLGGLLLAAPGGSFGADAKRWGVLGEALGGVARRAAALEGSHAECERLRLRVEEVEALDVLGLAANRTLDPDEVLALVARFSRTLLEADYVVVGTGEEGRVRAASWVGAAGRAPDDGDDPLARRVVQLGRPVYVGEGEDASVDAFPLHEAQGMRSGFGVPLSLFGRTLGALVVGYRAPYRVTRRDTRLAVTLARHAAVAISNAQLHRAVEGRSAELERANARLREMAGVKERFFNTMSHELRTPLNAMKGYTELILDGVGGEVPPQVHHYVQRCHASALNLLTLVDDLLDLARIEADRMPVQLEPCTLRDVVEQAIASVEPQAEAKGIRLTSLAAALPPLCTDAKRVRQILTNLLSNAVKFTPEGEVRLVCALAYGTDAGAEGGAEVEVRVSDTGPGIAPEHLDLIFHEYGQVPGSDGTGLGLPISRKLARLLGGDLEVESAPGAGSTFILRLPASAVEAHPAAATAA